MSKEIKPEILEIFPNFRGFSFCPENMINCEHLDLSITIIGNRIKSIACSNPEAQGRPELKIVTLSVCPFLKLAEEE